MYVYKFYQTLISKVFYQMIFQTRLHTDPTTDRNTKWALLENLTQTRLSQIQSVEFVYYEKDSLLCSKHCPTHSKTVNQ